MITDILAGKTADVIYEELPQWLLLDSHTIR